MRELRRRADLQKQPQYRRPYPASFRPRRRRFAGRRCAPLRSRAGHRERPAIQQARDIRMLQPGHDLPFRAKAVQQVRIAGGGNQFDRNLLADTDRRRAPPGRPRPCRPRPAGARRGKVRCAPARPRAWLAAPRIEHGGPLLDTTTATAPRGADPGRLRRLLRARSRGPWRINGPIAKQDPAPAGFPAIVRRSCSVKAARHPIPVPATTAPFAIPA
jgi:hypothetical protein